MSEALRIAIIGAESTGKTTLASDLATRLATDSGLRVIWVPEVLRMWCDNVGRTPLAHEQAAILRAQHERIEEAAATHDVVICDTTALMTAVYSGIVFGDHSLDARAAALHRRVSLTLLTAIDLPWVADGLQRDGPQVREPVDTALRQLMQTCALPWTVVGGIGNARLEKAVDAVSPLIRERLSPGSKLFSRLQSRQSRDERDERLRPLCECCSVPECERALRQRADY